MVRESAIRCTNRGTQLPISHQSTHQPTYQPSNDSRAQTSATCSASTGTRRRTSTKPIASCHLPHSTVRTTSCASLCASACLYLQSTRCGSGLLQAFTQLQAFRRQQRTTGSTMQNRYKSHPTQSHTRTYAPQFLHAQSFPYNVHRPQAVKLSLEAVEVRAAEALHALLTVVERESRGLQQHFVQQRESVAHRFDCFGFVAAQVPTAAAARVSCILFCS